MMNVRIVKVTELRNQRNDAGRRQGEVTTGKRSGGVDAAACVPGLTYLLTEPGSARPALNISVTRRVPICGIHVVSKTYSS